MRKLYIEFTKPNKNYKIFPVLSWLICLFERTEYSHVRLTWVNSTDRKVVYEASGTSVKFIGTLSQQKKKADIIESFEVDLTIEEYRSLIDLCMKYADVSYGCLQIVGIGLTYLPWFTKNPFADGDRSQVCSELVGEFLETVKGLEIKEDLDTAGPRLINEILSGLDRPDIRRVL